MAEQKKCAHEACKCMAPNNEKYCSPWCQDSKNMIEIVCQCGHPACKVAPTQA